MAYDPGQPRDKTGQWTSGGSGLGGGLGAGGGGGGTPRAPAGARIANAVKVATNVINDVLENFMGFPGSTRKK